MQRKREGKSLWLFLGACLILFFLGVPRLVRLDSTNSKGFENGRNDNIFSLEEQAEIEGIVALFANAMGRTTVDPDKNCPGIRDLLRSELIRVKALVDIASSLPTENFEDSRLARNILEAEIAYNLVDNNCSSKGL